MKLPLRNVDEYFCWSSVKRCEGSGYKPHQWYNHGGRSYIYVQTANSWAGAHVSSIDKCCINSLTWIGYSDAQESSWFWINGKETSFTNWCSGEPNNNGNENCALINWTSQGCWNDFKCTDPVPYICEKK
uniref:C-type lectin domain-containing protein n=1 Tax=Neogobius melanostomus TaxID=47308 RepID=A0A8C6SIH2_9GOBI